LGANEHPVVLLPTYNEADNLEIILGRILAAQPRFHVAVIDDNSPDGTGQLAQDWAKSDPRVHVVHRARKEGLGRAYLHGFEWALGSEAGYTHIFEMDADLSHDPAYLEPLLGACRDGADVAIGSRWVAGGGTRGWSLFRRTLSRGGSLYARTVLGVGVRDLTGGFKCFRRSVLEAIPLREVATIGYGFQIEMTYRALRQGFRVTEIPIVFPDRVHGESKLSLAICMEGVTSVWRLRRDV
jgi:dolichol-phosphate mannosyltransferase